MSERSAPKVECPSCRTNYETVVIDTGEYTKGVCDRCLYEWIIDGSVGSVHTDARDGLLRHFYHEEE